jgi:hypothetical protein
MGKDLRKVVEFFKRLQGSANKSVAASFVE